MIFTALKTGGSVMDVEALVRAGRDEGGNQQFNENEDGGSSPAVFV
jgi:hypothetical protein